MLGVRRCYPPQTLCQITCAPRPSCECLSAQGQPSNQPRRRSQRRLGSSEILLYPQTSYRGHHSETSVPVSRPALKFLAVVSYQSSINWYAEVQKSSMTGGSASRSGRRCVMRMPTSPSFGSTYQDVPKAPSQPKRPGTSARSLRAVMIPTPKPQPCRSQKCSKNGEAAFCSAVM